MCLSRAIERVDLMGRTQLGSMWFFKKITMKHIHVAVTHVPAQYLPDGMSGVLRGLKYLSLQPQDPVQIIIIRNLLEHITR